MAISKIFTPNRIAIFVFVAYLVIGVFIVDDFGISIDEGNEHKTSLITYVHVFGDLMLNSGQETVQNVALTTQDLSTWVDRYYGTALQGIPIMIEHLHGFAMPTRDIFLMRHLFTFLNYFAGIVFFYLILRRRFGNTFIPLVGALFFILYPRFFGESFFNIKDILFVAWIVIAVYFVLRWLEDGKAVFLILSAFTIAIATNTRILGISILLLTLIFSVILEIRKKTGAKGIILKPVFLLLLTFGFYIGITPFLWSNPIGNTIETFAHFIRFQPWESTHFYLGEMITSNVPWHYIPVWMSTTIPLLYLILFAIGVFSIIGRMICRARMKDSGLHFYEVFFMAMFFCTLLGYIVLHISIYEGWRHAYVLFVPFLFIAVYGLHQIYIFIEGRQKVLKYGITAVVTVSLCLQFIWIVVNHPYQYVYFNSLGKHIAEENFALDYWEVSHIDLIRFLLEYDDSPQIKADLGTSRLNLYMLNEAEMNRLVKTDISSANYIIQDTRIGYMSRVTPPGFIELKSIMVDGTRVSTLYERMDPKPVLDHSAWSNVERFSSNVNEDAVILHDDDFDTRWSTGRSMQAGDFMLFEFSSDVDYNYISMVLSPNLNEHPQDLIVSISSDGVNWTQMKVIGSYQFVETPDPYRFLKFEVGRSDPSYWWIVYEVAFGNL